MKKIVPAVMPAKGVHDAFSTGGRAWFFPLEIIGIKPAGGSAVLDLRREISLLDLFIEVPVSETSISHHKLHVNE